MKSKIQNPKKIIFFLILLTIFISVDFVFAEKKCTVNPVIDMGYPSIEKGKIPIGEAVDESELLAQNLIDKMENIIEEISEMQNTVAQLLPLPDLCECATTDCDIETLPLYDLCDCQCDGEYQCKCDYGLGYDYAYTEEEKYCECDCTTDDMYDYKSNCSCSNCDNFTYEYSEILEEYVCANNCECDCTDSTYVCQDSGCECECEYDEVSKKCECENCTPKNPEFECKCAPKDYFKYGDCDRPPCRNSTVRVICCSLLGCKCNYCYCTTCCGGEICPNHEIAIRIDATNDWNGCEKIDWGPTTTKGFNHCYSIGNIHLRITKSFKKIDNLIEVKNLIQDDPILPDDPNRWKMLNKLIDSREKFEKCITGYEFVKKGNKQQEQLFSCDMILREKYVNKTAILEYFDENKNKFPHCYPYTIESQKEISECIKGITVPCTDEIIKMELMDNYFCCKGE